MKATKSLSAKSKDGNVSRKGSSPPPPPIASPQHSPKTPPNLIEISVRSVMEGVPQMRVLVPPSCLVKDLKAVIADNCEIYPEKQLLLYKDKELRDDNLPVSSYGIVENCTLTMNIKMNTGVARRGGAAEIMFFLPAQMPEGNLGSLRSAIKGMSHVKGRNPKKTDKSIDKKSQIWTPEKQMEHELTRNRMKSLLRKRKKNPILSSTPIESCNGSIIGSVASRSPAETPPEYANPNMNTTPANAQVNELPITEKELKLFFEPAESMRQLIAMRKDMYTPPQNKEELEQLKMELAKTEKTRCRACRKRIPISEQTMLCLCQRVFCRTHRNPENHLCIIDYKQTGRSKLSKENPKIEEGGARKAKS